MPTGAKTVLQQPGTAWTIEVWPRGLQEAGTSVDILIQMLSTAGLVPAWIREGRMCVCPWDAVRAVCATRQPRSAVNLGCTHPGLGWGEIAA